MHFIFAYAQQERIFERPENSSLDLRTEVDYHSIQLHIDRNIHKQIYCMFFSSLSVPSKVIHKHWDIIKQEIFLCRYKNIKTKWNIKTKCLDFGIRFLIGRVENYIVIILVKWLPLLHCEIHWWTKHIKSFARLLAVAWYCVWESF